jgi:hypothetical protein
MCTLANKYDPQVDPEEFDRWGTLREIDKAQQDAKNTLRDGELVFTFAGSTLALIVGNTLDILYAGVVLTIVALFFSLLVVIRVAIVDELSYNSAYVSGESPERLMLMKMWNEGVIGSRASVSIAIHSIFFNVDSWYHRLGVNAYDDYLAEGKWKQE